MRGKVVKWTIGILVVIIGFVAKCAPDASKVGKRGVIGGIKVATSGADEAVEGAGKILSKQSDDAKKVRLLQKVSQELDADEVLEKSLEYIETGADLYDRYLDLSEGYDPYHAEKQKLIACVETATTSIIVNKCFINTMTNGSQNAAFQDWVLTGYVKAFLPQSDFYYSVDIQVSKAIAEKRIINYDSLFFQHMGRPQSIKEKPEIFRDFYNSTYVTQFLRLKETYCKGRKKTNLSCEQMAVYNFQANHFNAMGAMLPEEFPQPIKQLKEFNKTIEIDFKDTIIQFLAAEDERNIETILGYYSRDISRYYDSKKPTFEELMKRYLFIWSFTTNAKNSIQNITKVNDYTYDVQTLFNYYNTKKAEQKSSLAWVRFLFNREGEIIEIYGLD